VEARDGVEPPKKGFAGLPLIIWVPRREYASASNIYRNEHTSPTFSRVHYGRS
jgi:hypothetical protein